MHVTPYLSYSLKLNNYFVRKDSPSISAGPEQNLLLLVILIKLLMEIAATPVLPMEDVMPNTMDDGSTNRAHVSPNHSEEVVLECQGNAVRTVTPRSIVARNE